MPPSRFRNPCSYLPRRLQIVASLTAFILFCIIFLGSSSTADQYLEKVPYGSQLESGAHQVVDRLPRLPKDLPHVDPPQWLNPFRAPAHSPPPEQADSRSGDTKWFSDWKWKNPFSSSVTLDHERAVLPPVRNRPPVYTYLDIAGRNKDEKMKKAEQALLHIWRRAWWAQGFTPVVLSSAEATNNPLYRKIQHLKLNHDLETELMRWLAWHDMKGGILCNWLALPMAHYDEPLLAFLRQGEYPELTRYKDLDNGLFVGSKASVEAALHEALESSNLEKAGSITELVKEDTFKVEPEHEGIAFYSPSTIKTKYPTITPQLESAETKASGFGMLASLINSHLHNTWQNWFTSGIAVLKPLAQSTTGLIEPAIEIATNLSQCADSPLPASCPPNRPSCRPCVSSAPMRVITPPVFRNSSTLFTIATVPHPYTLQTMIHNKENMDTKFMRRNTTRDTWIMAATKELLGTGISSFARLADLKDAVASESGTARSLWLNGEEPMRISNPKDREDLDWFFGFEIDGPALKTGKSETPVPGPERRPPPPKQEFDGPVPDEETLQQQRSLLEASKPLVLGTATGTADKGKELARKRNVIEAWNLADTETWKFVRAFAARRSMERRKFDEGEAKYLGEGTYERWRDYVKGVNH